MTTTDLQTQREEFAENLVMFVRRCALAENASEPDA